MKLMRNLLSLSLLLLVALIPAACSSKADKAREQQIADSLRRDSIAADSLEKVKAEEALNDEKIEFLKSLYQNIIYPTDDNVDASFGYAEKFEKHLSAKVTKVLTDYDDGIDDGFGGPGQPANTDPQFYLLGDECDYGNVGPKISYECLKDGWFKVTIAKNKPLKIRVESDKDDEENFIITGVDLPMVGIKVE